MLDNFWKLLKSLKQTNTHTYTHAINKSYLKIVRTNPCKYETTFTNIKWFKIYLTPEQLTKSKVCFAIKFKYLLLSPCFCSDENCSGQFTFKALQFLSLAGIYIWLLCFQGSFPPSVLQKDSLVTINYISKYNINNI